MPSPAERSRLARCRTRSDGIAGRLRRAPGRVSRPADEPSARQVSETRALDDGERRHAASILPKVAMNLRVDPPTAPPSSRARKAAKGTTDILGTDHNFRSLS